MITRSVEKRLFSVDEFHQMIETGILNEDDRVELVEGEITRMIPVGRRHAACVRRLTNAFAKAIDDQAMMESQNPIRLSEHTELYPDLTLLKPAEDWYESRLPGPDDVLLVVEVSDATLEFVRGEKKSLYAGNGIQEYWLINLVDDVIERHDSPADGAYTKSEVNSPKDNISPRALADIELSVDFILGTSM